MGPLPDEGPAITATQRAWVTGLQLQRVGVEEGHLLAHVEVAGLLAASFAHPIGPAVLRAAEPCMPGSVQNWANQRITAAGKASGRWWPESGG